MQLREKHLRVLFVPVLITGSMMLTACVANATAREDTGVPEWSDSFSACMSQAGWSVSVRSDGGVESEYPESQRPVYEAQAALCADQAGSGIKPTEEEFEVGYEGLIEDHECIVKEGYSLPQPPSYQAWREIDGQWNPFMDLPRTLTQDQLTDLIDVCTPTGT